MKQNNSSATNSTSSKHNTNENRVKGTVNVTRIKKNNVY